MQVYVVTQALLPKDAVKDTTGAGDAFIGSVLYGITMGMPVEDMLRLAGTVAACKCTGVGARPALPHAADLGAHMLSSSP